MEEEKLKSFLEALYGEHLKEHKGYIEILSKINAGVKKYSFKNISDLIEIYHNEEWYNQTADYFLGVAPRKSAKYGTKDYIKFTTALWVDIDYGEEGHKKKSKFKNIKEALAHIETLTPKPSIIVNSGHGLHLYWLLNKSEKVSDLLERNKIEIILDGIIKATGGDIGTNDITKKLRLPGTKNTKIPECVKECEIIFNDYSLKYDLSDFSEYEKIGVKALDSLEIVDVGEIEEVTFEQLQKSSIQPTILDIIKNGDEAERYPSRSERDQSIITELLLNDFTPEQIVSVFSNPDFPISDKFYEKGKYRYKYIALSISRAKDFIETNKIEIIKKNQRAIVPVPRDLNQMVQRFLDSPLMPWEKKSEYKKTEDGEHYLIYKREEQEKDRTEIREYIIKKDTLPDSDKKRVPLQFMKEAYIISLQFAQTQKSFVVEFTLADKLKYIDKTNISGREIKERFLAEILLANTQYRRRYKRGNTIIQEYQNLYAGVTIGKGDGLSPKFEVTLNPTYLKTFSEETGKISGSYITYELPLKEPRQSRDKYRKRALAYFHTLGRFNLNNPKYLQINVITILKTIKVKNYELVRPGNCKKIWEHIKDTIEEAGHKIVKIEVAEGKDRADVRNWKLIIETKLKIAGPGVKEVN